MGNPCAARRADPFRLGAGAGERQPDRARQVGLQHFAGARRAARIVGRAAGNHPPDLRRGAYPSGGGEGGGRRARRRAGRARLPPAREAGRDPLDAQGPLSDHAGLHAQEGHARAGHDGSDLHGAGQSGFRVRSRHGAQDAGRARAPAGRDRAVRQLALRRGQAQRLLLLSQPCLGGHRPRPLRHPALRLRGRHELRALCRLRARRADVFRLPRRHLYRRQRPVLPRLSRRKAARAAGRKADDVGLGGPSDHAVPGGPAQALYRDARRRWRAVAAAVRAAGTLGRAALRPVGARCGLRADRRLDRGRTPEAAPRDLDPGPQDAVSGRHPARRRAAGSWGSPMRG